MKTTITLSLCAIALGLAGASLQSRSVASAESTPEDAAGFALHFEGEMKRVHREGDASPRVDLGKLAERTGAFAIGPLAGLCGEITALDGAVYVARVEGGKPIIEKDWQRQAPFLVYGHVTSWKEVPLPAAVQTPKDLEAHLPEAARAAGLDASAPFPFKVHVPDGKLDYHIMNNTEDGNQIKRPHKELMVHFPIRNRPATLIGVYSTEHAGVFTHHGDATHIHAVSDDGQDAGHLDGATLGGGATLFLPVP